MRPNAIGRICRGLRRFNPVSTNPFRLETNRSILTVDTDASNGSPPLASHPETDREPHHKACRSRNNALDMRTARAAHHVPRKKAHHSSRETAEPNP